MVFVHAEPHWVIPVVQVEEQLPIEQTSPPAHACPQLPQFAGSVCVVAQLCPASPEQSIVPAGQAHEPVTQVVPIVHAVLQWPQLVLSLCRSTHVEPHESGVLPEQVGVVGPPASIVGCCVTADPPPAHAAMRNSTPSPVHAADTRPRRPNLATRISPTSSGGRVARLSFSSKDGRPSC